MRFYCIFRTHFEKSALRYVKMYLSFCWFLFKPGSSHEESVNEMVCDSFTTQAGEETKATLGRNVQSLPVDMGRLRQSHEEDMGIVTSYILVQELSREFWQCLLQSKSKST